MTLRGQVAIVTGGNSGIGEGVAKALGEAGAAVVVDYVSGEDRAQQVVEAIQQSGSRALAVRADVSDEDQVHGLFGKTIQSFGSLDILVANAGIQKDSPFLHLSLDDWNEVLSVNLTGAFLCARAAARQFVKQGVRPHISCSAGKILFMSSVHEVIPWAGHVNYAVSKGGMNQLMLSVAQELAEYKIRVNSIAPGAIKTPINREAWATPEAEKQLLKLIPYGRVGVPADIGKAAIWMLSDEAEYVHGTTLFVDGGMTLYPGFSEGGG